MVDWVVWHAQYERADSSLARRLVVVRRRIAEALASLPPALACAALEALRILSGPEGDERREKLRQNAKRFANGQRPEYAIQPLILGEPERAMSVASKKRPRPSTLASFPPATIRAPRTRASWTSSSSSGTWCGCAIGPSVVFSLIGSPITYARTSGSAISRKRL